MTTAVKSSAQITHRLRLMPAVAAAVEDVVSAEVMTFHPVYEQHRPFGAGLAFNTAKAPAMLALGKDVQLRFDLRSAKRREHRQRILDRDCRIILRMEEDGG